MNEHFAAETAVRTTALIKKRIAMEQVIGGVNFADVDYRMNDYIADNFYLRLKAYVLGETTQDIKINVPVTWWDAFKDEKFPDWLKEKFPPRFTKHHVVVDAVLPNFRVALPDQDYSYIVGYNVIGANYE